MSDNSFPDYQPKRFGLRYNPSTIVLEYLVPSTGKLYHHKMRLQRLTGSSDPQPFLEYLKNRHSVYLTHTKITDDQLTGLILHLRDKMKKEETTDIDEIDLNKLTPEEVMQYKKKMDLEFNKNQLRPGDEGYEYDLRKDFVPEDNCSWDESEDEIV